MAQIVRDAEIAEAEAIGQAERLEAEMEEVAEVVRTEAETVVLEKDNAVRTQGGRRWRSRHDPRRNAPQLQNWRRKRHGPRTEIAEGASSELERLRLQAEEVLPAQAESEGASELRARGKAAATAEDVKASALVNDLLTNGVGTKQAARRNWCSCSNRSRWCSSKPPVYRDG